MILWLLAVHFLHTVPLSATIRLIMPWITLTSKDNWEQWRYKSCRPVWRNSRLFFSRSWEVSNAVMKASYLIVNEIAPPSKPCSDSNFNVDVVIYAVIYVVIYQLLYFDIYFFSLALLRSGWAECCPWTKMSLTPLSYVICPLNWN